MSAQGELKNARHRLEKCGETVETVEVALSTRFTQLTQGVNERGSRLFDKPCMSAEERRLRLE